MFRTSDFNKELKKDCKDFEPLDDGTLLGDWRYCAKSFLCRQIGMESHYVKFIKSDGTEVMEFLCTGKYKSKDYDEDGSVFIDLEEADL